MKCLGILGHLFGHKFRPRYDVKERERGKLKIDTYYDGDLRELFTLTDSTYVCDVCLRCGEQRKRGAATDGQAGD